MPKICQSMSMNLRCCPNWQGTRGTRPTCKTFATDWERSRFECAMRMQMREAFLSCAAACSTNAVFLVCRCCRQWSTCPAELRRIVAACGRFRTSTVAPMVEKLWLKRKIQLLGHIIRSDPRRRAGWGFSLICGLSQDKWPSKMGTYHWEGHQVFLMHICRVQESSALLRGMCPSPGFGKNGTGTYHWEVTGICVQTSEQDPMRQVLFLPNSLIPRTEHARRVGKPRAQWLIETYADAYRESGHVDQFDINNILQRIFVNELAQQRLNIFSWHSIAHLFTESFITESFITESFVTESSHHQKLRQRKFRHRKRAYSRPGLRNKRCLHTLFAPFASVPPPLVW